VRYEEAPWIRALFYGIGPAVAALIAEACFRLSGRYVTDWKMAILALVCLMVTVIVQAEMAILFIAGGLVGIFVYARPLWKSGRPSPPVIRGFAGMTLAGLLGGLALSKSVELGLFFVKAGAFTFGSGLAVAPFIHQSLVIENHWLTERQFLDTVAMGMITPGPVVIMSTFAGYLIDGVRGAVVASVAVFLPIYLMVVFAASFFVKHKDNPNVSGFVKGATAAAVGSISGAGIIIGKGVIVDWLTIVIASVSLFLIMRWKTPGLAIVAVSGLIGLWVYR
ncbi:MAG: chromate efflux transporter, partial [Deltaproteobacteria bacterium]|nr:chromate efflux transporter [Deltaproteobacteria bacterium]